MYLFDAQTFIVIGCIKNNVKKVNKTNQNYETKTKIRRP